MKNLKDSLFRSLAGVSRPFLSGGLWPMGFNPATLWPHTQILERVEDLVHPDQRRRKTVERWRFP